MVHCPIFLKKEQGISITELLIVVAFIAALAVALLVFLNPGAQMGKARDARRKSDLSKLKNILEDYYNDKNCYPTVSEMECGQALGEYLDKIPCDPLTKASYGYSANCSSYRIYAELEYEKDPAIAEVGCQGGCGPGGSCDYNYGVCSSNVGLEGCGEEECAGTWWACQGNECNSYIEKPTCVGGGTPYCNDSTCDGGCPPAKCCTDCGGT